MAAIDRLFESPSRTITVEFQGATRGFSCDIWVDPPGQVWEDFRYNFDELFMLMEGDIGLTVQNKAFRPKVGRS